MDLKSLNNELVTAIKDGKLAFFVGAGISKSSPSFLPLGNELVSAIILSLGKGTDILMRRYCPLILDAIVKRNKAIRLEVILHIIENQIGDKVFNLLRIFEKDHPNKNHIFLANCLRYGNMIVTTNFDSAIERACDETGTDYVACFDNIQYKQFINRASPKLCIFKLHGTLKERSGNYRIDTIQATLNQVGKGLTLEKACMLESLLKKYDFIFLGYSGLDDFDIYPKLLNTVSTKRIFWVNHKNSKRLSVIEYKKSQFITKSRTDHVTVLLNQRKNTIRIMGNTSKFIGNLWESLGFNNIPRPPISHIYKWVEVVEKWAQEIEESDRLTIFGDILEYQGLYDYAINCYELAEKKTDSSILKARIFRKIGWALEQKGKYSLALKYFNKEYRLAKSSSNISEMLKAIYNLGWIMQRNGKYTTSISFFTRALDQPEKSQFKMEVAEIYNGLGVTYWYMGDWNSAIQAFKKNLKLSASRGDIEGLARAYNNIGLVYWKKRAYKKAIDYFLKSLELYQKIGNLYGMGSTYGNLGIIYRNLCNWKKALMCHHRSVNFHTISGSDHNRAMALNNIANIHYDLGNFKKALFHYKRCKHILLKIGHPHGIAMINCNIGKVYKEGENIESATLLFKKVLNIANRMDDALEISCDTNYYFAEAVFKALNDNQKALRYALNSLKFAHRLGDQVRQGISERLLAELALAINNVTGAEKHITNSVKLLEGRMPLYEIGRSYCTLSKILQRKGEASKSKKYLIRSMKIFSELGMKNDLKKALKIV